MKSTLSTLINSDSLENRKGMLSHLMNKEESKTEK